MPRGRPRKVREEESVLAPVAPVKAEPKMKAAKESKIKTKGKRKKKPPGPCITGCLRTERDEGFCGGCYAKYLKGYYTKSGKKHPDVIAKEKALIAKREKIIVRAGIKKREQIKQDISKGLNNNLLKVLQNTVPESKQSKYCDKLQFFTCDAVCYSRLFVQKKPECESCKIHDHKFDFLQEFIKENTDDTIRQTGPREGPATASNAGPGQASKSP